MPISSSADLLNLLATCLPDNGHLEKEALIQTLVETPAYQRFAASMEFRHIFDQYYSPEALQKVSLARVRSARFAVAVAPQCFATMAASLRTGDAPKLTKEDFPDLYSAEDLRLLARRLEGTTGYNYTNIPPEDFMEIFSDVTIKDPQDVYGQFDEGVTDYEVEIEQAAAGRPYCISAAALDELEDQYDMLLRNMRQSGRNSTEGFFGKRLNRLLITLGLVGVVAVMNCFMQLYPDVGVFSVALLAIVGVIFVIWG